MAPNLPFEPIIGRLARRTSTRRASLVSGAGDLADGDRQLLAEISKLFVDDAPRHLEKIREAIERRDGESLRRAAHGLKGAAANFEADGVVSAARTLEEIGRTAAFGRHEDAWRALTIETERLVSTLTRVAAG